MDNLYHYNERYYQWERVDRIQEYRGCKIETLTVHSDYSDPMKIIRHREYRTTYPSGKVVYTTINKREGGNIKDIKEYIDFKIKHGESL